MFRWLESRSFWSYNTHKSHDSRQPMERVGEESKRVGEESERVGERSGRVEWERDVGGWSGVGVLALGCGGGWGVGGCLIWGGCWGWVERESRLGGPSGGEAVMKFVHFAARVGGCWWLGYTDRLPAFFQHWLSAETPPAETHQDILDNGNNYNRDTALWIVTTPQTWAMFSWSCEFWTLSSSICST